MTQENMIEVLITSDTGSILQAAAPHRALIIILVEPGQGAATGVHERLVAHGMICHWASLPGTRQLIFIAPEDEMAAPSLLQAISQANSDHPAAGITFLVPYKTPPAVIYEKQELPKYGQRLDGQVRSFMVSPRHFIKEVAALFFDQWGRLVFELAHAYLNKATSTNIPVIQVGKPIQASAPAPAIKDQLQRSLMVIPHAGPLSLLYRCLSHLNQESAIPATINLCFDDSGYEQVRLDNLDRVSKHLQLFRNEPLRVGPYPARHYAIAGSDKDYIFFQDSDDISAPGRFSGQLEELERRGLDMIGSHEIRLDEFEKAILIFRYPLDVSESLSALCFHPLFHPTTLITRKAYLKTGGFSTNLRFGYDSQFLLRSHFYLKIGNADDFYYLRFKRPDSLTTDPSTHMDSEWRQFLIKRWSTDFRLVIEDKLDLKDSSISIQQHRFDYRLVPLPGAGQTNAEPLQQTYLI